MAKRKSGSSEQGLELTDEAVNLINEIFDRRDDWLGFDNVRLSDGYIKGELRIVLRATLAGEEWLILFECIAKIGRGESGNSKILLQPITLDMHGNITNSGNRSEQSMMLIGNVQFVEYPEIMALPVFIRFGAPDFILGILPHSMYLSSKRGFVNMGTLENRESRPIGDREGMAANIDKMTGQMIQRASHVVDRVSGKKTDWIGHRLNVAREEDIKILISRLRVWLGVEGVKLALEKPIPSGFQITEVLLGPFDFYADTRETFSSRHFERIPFMSKTSQNKATQKTPKERFEIPIPKRGDVLKVFKKAATSQAKSGPRSPEK